MKARPLPSQEELAHLFCYDPDTGNLCAKIRLSKKTLAGQVLKCKNKKGYLHFNFNGRFYYAHRVVWKLCTGEEPNIIDHINGDKSDNRLTNLRSVTSSQNNLNQKDAKGYYKVKNSNPPRYVVELQGRYLGSFSSTEEAQGVYFEARRKLGGL